MSNLNFSSVRNCYLNLIFYTILFVFYLPCLGQNVSGNVNYHVDDIGNLTLTQLPDREKILELIDSARLESGMSVTAVAIDLKIPLNAFSKNNSSSDGQVFTLNIYNPNLAFNFNVNANDLAEEDYVIIKNELDSITINHSSVNKNPFFKNLINPISIKLFDSPPYHNSSLELNNLSIKPEIVKTGKNQDFGDAGSCQVNAKCYADNVNFKAIDAAVLIQWRNGNFIGFCTGSLVVNSNYDNTPYVLTAEHCALFDGFVSNADLSNWVFFFNYQSTDCENPASDNGLNQQTLTGAEWVARSNDQGGETGSDFLLLKLNNTIPGSYNAFFAGWNRSGLPPASGRSYHHPKGDIKKVSAYYYSPNLGSFANNEPNTHWLVIWSSSSYGFGTTEEGSSGSALLDENGLIKGVLTGGSSSCSNPNGLDYYGTMAYSWTSNGSAPENQLKPWLDPANTGYLAMPPEQATDEPREINVTPNPVSDGNIQLADIGIYDQEITLELFAMSGQKVAFKKAAPIPGNGINLKVKQYQPGMYILQFKQGSEIVTKKVLLL